MPIVRIAKLSGLTALFLLAAATSLEAVVGTVDAADEFPFVVRLETEYANGESSWCSGVVHGHVLSTAG